MSTNFINLTPHSIHLQGPDGAVLEVPVSGPAARVAVHRGKVLDYMTGPVGDIPVFDIGDYGTIEGLPGDVAPGDCIIVSLIVLEKAGEEIARLRLGAPSTVIEAEFDRETRIAVLSACVAPGTGPDDGAIRNEKGHIVAVTRLIGLP